SAKLQRFEHSICEGGAPISANLRIPSGLPVMGNYPSARFFHRHRFRHYPTITSAPLDIHWIAVGPPAAAQRMEGIVSQFAGLYRERAPHAWLRGHVRC